MLLVHHVPVAASLSRLIIFRIPLAREGTSTTKGGMSVCCASIRAGRRAGARVRSRPTATRVHFNHGTA